MTATFTGARRMSAGYDYFCAGADGEQELKSRHLAAAGSRLASPPCPIQFSTLFCMMAERTSDRTDLPATLAFIFGAIVIVASIGSLLLTLFAVVGIHI